MSEDEIASKDQDKVKIAWHGRDRMHHIHNPPDLWDLGTRELRFQTTRVMGILSHGDWLRVSHYGTHVGGIVRPDDLEFLAKVGDCASVDALIDALTEWKRCGPAAPLVEALKSHQSGARMAGPTRYSKRLGDFEHCQPSPHEASAPKHVDFGDAVLPSGQIALASLADGRTFLHGFIERANPDTKFLLELPTGEIIEDFEEDGPLLNLRRTPLSAPICLHDIRIRER